MGKQRFVMLDRLFCLALFTLRCRRPILDLVVIQIHDLRRHQVPGDHCRFCKMDRQVEPGKLIEDLQGFFDAPVSLVHMGLNADHIDLDTRLEAAFHQDVVGWRDVEVVDQQDRRWVRFAGGLEHGPDRLDASQLTTQPRDAIVVFVEDGHDDCLIDHIPHIDQPGKIRHIPPDARCLCLQDLSIGQWEQPVCCECVPAQRMSFGA